jgi:hypothetical protein
MAELCPRAIKQAENGGMLVTEKLPYFNIGFHCDFGAVYEINIGSIHVEERMA